MTVSPDAKAKTYTLSKLNAYHESKDYKRCEQVWRAFKDDLKHVDGASVPCPICRRRFKKQSKFIKHVGEDHPRQMWDNEDEHHSPVVVLEQTGEEFKTGRRICFLTCNEVHM